MQATAQREDTIALPQLPLESDLFGQVLLDCLEGRANEYYLRRDDNYVERDGSGRYFQSWEKMPAHHRCLINHVRGRVLDLGTGAGQHALVLQERGADVTAIDTSPLAVDICQRRGVRDARLMDATALDLPEASYDTALLMSNSLGIAGTPDGLRGLLGDLHRIVRPGGQILADFTDYSTTHDPAHLRYHRHNMQRGRYPGSIRMRIEHDGKCGAEFDWLLIKLTDLRAICEETGWKIARCVQTNTGMFAIGMERA